MSGANDFKIGILAAKVEMLEEEALALDDELKEWQELHANLTKSYNEDTIDFENKITSLCDEVKELKLRLANSIATCETCHYITELKEIKDKKTKETKTCPLFKGRAFGSSYCNEEGCMMWHADNSSSKGYCTISYGFYYMKWIGGTE